MADEIWIINGLVFTEEGFQLVDLKLKDGKIESIIKTLEPIRTGKKDVVDASGCLVVPGFIDAHVHFNDPGRTLWEGMETGSRAAAIGGTTTVFDMPLNCSPSITTLQSLVDKREYIAPLSHIDYALWGGMTETNLHHPAELTEMSKGIIGWKAFMSGSGIEDFPYLLPENLKIAMQLAREHNKILALHAEWEEEIVRLTTYYKHRPGMNERKAFLASRPVSSEVKAVNYALELGAKYGTALHFVHISSAEAARVIEQAKKSGINVTTETCPHYLLFDEQDFIKQGPVFKCAPPLRPRAEVEELWDCVANGVFDTIGSDHSPCLYSMKSADSIWDAWGGIQGVQYTWLSLVDEALKRKIPLKYILPLGTSNVADRFGISDRKGRIRTGHEADLVLIRLDETTLADKSSFAFRNAYSPYENKEFLLRIKKTILRGKVIYDDQIGVTEEKYGKCL